MMQLAVSDWNANILLHKTDYLWDLLSHRENKFS